MHYLIAHAAWAPGRKASLARLREQLPEARTGVVASRGPEHAAIWSRRLWQMAATTFPYEHVCLLNDDVTLAPDFAARIDRAITAVPDEPISLCCNNPNVADISGAWARCYHYSGPGVVLSPGDAASLLAYVYELPWSVLSRLNEDNIANAWAWSRQRPFWYLLPSPLSHDTAVPSTLGYDNHPHRQPVLQGAERDPAVADKSLVPFVELDWCLSQGLAYRREVLRLGRHLCTLCVGREGVVGNLAQGIVLCRPCLAELVGAVLK